MKTEIKFESKHIGEAFVKELEEMGYEYHGDGLLRMEICVIVLIGNGRYMKPAKGAMSNFDKSFQLETDWAEALSHARRQLQPKPQKGEYWITNLGVSYVVGKSTNSEYPFSVIDIEEGWSDNEAIGGYFKHKATPEEIKSALVKECERRGLHDGNFECLILHAKPIERAGEKYDYSPDNDFLFIYENCVYMKGKWAEKIEDKFFDWDVEKKEHNVVCIECHHFDKTYLRNLKDDLEHVSDKTVQEVINELNKIL